MTQALSDSQQGAFDGSVHRMRLDADDVAGSVVMDSPVSGIQPDDQFPRARTRTLHDAQELQALVSDRAAGGPGADLDDLTSRAASDPRRAVMALALGGDGALAATAAELFPLRVHVAAARDVTVRAGTTWTLEGDGHHPLVLSLGTITLESGASIACGVPVHLTVQKFIKH